MQVLNLWYYQTMAEGNSPEPESSNQPTPTEEVKINAYGEIEQSSSTQPKNGPEEPWVDPDDLPENQGKHPKDSLAALRDRLNNARPVELDSQGNIINTAPPTDSSKE